MCQERNIPANNIPTAPLHHDQSVGSPAGWQREPSVSRLLQIFGIVVFLLLAGAPGLAQWNASNTKGYSPTGIEPGAPAGAYPLSGFEQINYYNGGLNVTIPLLSVGGRGGAQFTVPLVVRARPFRVSADGYDPGNGQIYYSFSAQNAWWQPWDPTPNYGPGILTTRFAGEVPVVDPLLNNFAPSVYSQFRAALSFSAPDGTEYDFYDQQTNGATMYSTVYTTYNFGRVFIAKQNAQVTFVSDSDVIANNLVTFNDQLLSGWMYLPNGTRYRIGGTVSKIIDRNGNQISFTYDTSGRVLTIVDSLKRQVTFAYNVALGGSYGTGDLITYQGFGGATRQIRVTRASLSTALRSGYTYNANPFPQLTGVGGFAPNPSVPKTLWLPDGRKYEFRYNDFHEVARVELPTGGAIEYDWAAGVINGPANGVVGRWNNPWDSLYQPMIEQAGIYRRVITRRVYQDLNSSVYENRQEISRPESIVASQAGSFNEGYQNSGAVQVNTYSYAGTLLTGENHTFHAYNNAYTSITHHVPFSDPAWVEGKEILSEAFASNGTTRGALLRRVDSVLGNGHVDAVTTTLSDSNQVTKKTFTYDNHNNQTDVYEYDYGTGAAPATYVRRTHTDYLTTNPVNGQVYNTPYPINPSNSVIHMRNLPSQTQVFDASGNKKAETKFEYDDYSASANHAALVNRTNISGLEAGFTTGYTTRGNVTKASQWRNTDGAYLSAYSQYDIVGNVVKAIDANGNATNLEFNDRFGAPNGEAQSNTNPSELSAVGQSSFAFPTKVTNALNHIAYTQLDYYTGKPVDTEDPNNIKSSLYYEDLLDRPTKGIRAVGTSLQNQTLITYDDANKTISTTTDKDANTDGILQGKALYDGLGRTYRSARLDVSNQWAIVETQFDALGRAYRSSNPFRGSAPTVALPADPQWTTSTFDALSRVIQVTMPDGAHVDTSYSGTVVTVTDQAGKQRRSLTDGLGRLTRVDEPSGCNTCLGSVTAPSQPTSYSYDTLDNLTTVTQGAQTRTFAYDSLKRLTAAANSESGTTTYIYDNNGNLTFKQDALNRMTWYPYDALNRSQGFYTNQANTPQVAHYYDSATNGKGKLAYSLTFDYYVGGSTQNALTLNVINGYDVLGHPQGQIQYYRNAANTDWAAGYTTSRTYDLASNVKSQTYPSGRTVNYSYNVAGQLTDFTGNLGDGTPRNYVNNATYSAAGLKERESYGLGANGMTTPLYLKLHYNKRHQLGDLRLSSINDEWDWNRGALTFYYGTNAINNWNPFADSPDNNGNLRRALHYVPLNDANTAYVIPQLADYSYDELNRVTNYNETQYNGSSWLYNVVGQTFAYDRYGNRNITATIGGVNGYNPSYSTSNNRIVGLTYDTVGNITYDGVRAMTYDANNKLVTVSSGGGTASYKYNASSNRIVKTVNGVTTWYIYGLDGELVAEYPAYGAPSTPYIEYGYRSGQLLIEGGCDSVRWRVTDHLGSTRISVGATGSLASVKRTDYLPFGEELGAGYGLRSASYGYNVDCWRQKFTGYERDAETGLDYAQARMFASWQGRFTSVDPLLASGKVAVPQSWNRYAYTWNNPLIAIDPNGEEGVVVSGQPGNHKRRDHFLENGLDRAQKVKKEAKPGEKVTWFIYNGGSEKNGYTEAQIKPYKEKAEKAGISVQVVSDQQKIVDYVNEKTGGDSRSKDLVTNFTYVGHAIPGDLNIGYGDWADELDFEEFKADSFSANSVANVVAACNTAVSPGFLSLESSVAEQLADIVGGKVLASDNFVYFPGGAVSDKKLLEKFKGNVVELKGRGGNKKAANR